MCHNFCVANDFLIVTLEVGKCVLVYGAAFCHDMNKVSMVLELVSMRNWYSGTAVLGTQTPVSFQVIFQERSPKTLLVGWGWSIVQIQS